MSFLSYFADVGMQCAAGVLRAGWASGAGSEGFRRTSRSGHRPADAQTSATDPGRDQPVRRSRSFPRSTQIPRPEAGRVADVDLWEINEAFAAVPLKVIRDLGLDPERVNVNGGAIALGHPIGATGPMLMQTVLDELERRDLSTALVTMCTGGGMGTATVIERV